MSTSPQDPDSPSLEMTPVQDEQALDESRQLSLRSGRVPNSVGGYDVLRCLGEGSFGMVWLARERKTGRHVAIKFFTNRRGLDWTLLTREVEKLAALDTSRDVVRLIDVGWDHDPPYFVMEYLPRESVASLLEAGPIPVAQAVEITKSVARALVHAHGAGILHCDIKPANILLDHGDEARLGDFGQSRLTSDQSPALGTFYYMAPEQATMDAIPGVRWDVYALGAVLYHMLTGATPYQSDEAEQLIAKATGLSDRLRVYREIIESSPVPNDHRNVEGVDRALASLIDDCLKRNPSERVPNPQVILDRLEQREINRSRRPLIFLGFLGPVLFMLMLAWIASTAVPEAVQEAELNLFERALTSDEATVRLLASSVDQELLERTDELVRLAARLPEEAGEGSLFGFREDYSEFLDQWREETDNRFRKQKRTRDASLFLTDRAGIQIYRNPWDNSIGHSFAYRDYFHDLGRELERSRRVGGEVQPRKTAGVSLAFRSSNTNQYMVAVAVPVWNTERTEVLGVLARTIHLTELLSQWERRIRGVDSTDDHSEQDRFLSLVDMREEKPFLLDHQWMSAQNLSKLSDNEMIRQKIELSKQETEVMQNALKGKRFITNYKDPLADVDEKYQGEWLAAVAEISSANWIAIVQERRSEAVAPMDELRAIFIRYGQLMVVVFAAMLAVLGWIIRRVSNRA
ncbi:protein kinase domain-containing protein [Thalassoglobus polymorphus]|uniref:Serine/threonine-protein kinase PrkC n=1 Tax=Thalassoglobus polymorphus TaxID=2527994 RepID=A0A517QHP4_9PLAN|nr:protein kinase [Thalassoglobus polymorphus]QDT31152.1 Serine/threonine-protein kinase PrkC [Thalassoglobus polymorphus]